MEGTDGDEYEFEADDETKELDDGEAKELEGEEYDEPAEDTTGAEAVKEGPDEATGAE